MADRIAIMGGEPYAEWIERDGTAQRLYKAYCDKWPDGDTQCVAIGSEFYVRFRDGEGMRRIYNVGDFDDEDEWCAQCGTPIDPDGGGVSWWDGERLRVFKNVDPLKVVGFIFSHWDSLKPDAFPFRHAWRG